MRVVRALIDALRGGLIGFAEVIPGVSGGTIALVVGVYDTVIGSAAHLVRGVAVAVRDALGRRGMSRARGHLAQVRWGVLIPLVVGMAAAVVIGARVIAPLVEDHPGPTRAVFAGLILASLVVPIRMVGRWSPGLLAAAAFAAAAAFVLTGLPAAAAFEPPLWLVALAAAVAVCALVLPGMSGSFLLLAIGLYAPTLAAVNDRDLVYLGIFALGAVVGLALFVPVLQRLLERRRAITLAIMTGLMVGSLRALWPWQTDDGALQAPGDDLLTMVGLMLAGAAVVVSLLVVESRLVRRRAASGEDVLEPEPARESAV